jgi:hypothetical protein
VRALRDRIIAEVCRIEAHVPQRTRTQDQRAEISQTLVLMETDPHALPCHDARPPRSHTATRDSNPAWWNATSAARRCPSRILAAMPVPAMKASASQVWRQMSLRILPFMAVHTTCEASHRQVPKVTRYRAGWREQHGRTQWRGVHGCGYADEAHSTLAIMAAAAMLRRLIWSIGQAKAPVEISGSGYGRLRRRELRPTARAASPALVR